MTDPIALLRRAADEAADQVREPDPVGAVRARVAHQRHRRRVRVGVAAAAALVVLAGAVALVTAQDDQQGVVVTPSPDPPTTLPGPTDHTDPAPTDGPADVLARSPLTRRGMPAIAVVGSPGDHTVVVWGGRDLDDRPIEDGAVYDMASDRWRPLAPSPLVGRPDEGEQAFAAGIGSGVVMARGRAVARWSRDGTWAELDDAPAPVFDLVAVGGTVASVSANAVLDNESPAWLPADAPPVALDRPAVASSGSEVFAIGRYEGAVVALVLDPLARTWRRGADAPAGVFDGAGGLLAEWDGGRVVVASADRRAATFDPRTDTWTPLPDIPVRRGQVFPSMVEAAGRVTVAIGDALVVLEGDRWIPRAAPVSLATRPVALRGTSAVLTWNVFAGPNDRDLFVDDLSLPPRRVRVGAVTLGLADGDVVDEAMLDRDTDAVSVAFSMADGGGTCRVTSVVGAPRGTASQRAVEEEVVLDGGSKIWFRDEAGEHWETEVGDQDLLTVDCTTPDDARRLAETLPLRTG